MERAKAATKVKIIHKARHPISLKMAKELVATLPVLS
jgi:hypothetical protein